MIQDRLTEEHVKLFEEFKAAAAEGKYLGFHQDNKQLQLVWDLSEWKAIEFFFDDYNPWKKYKMFYFYYEDGVLPAPEPKAKLIKLHKDKLIKKYRHGRKKKQDTEARVGGERYRGISKNHKRTSRIQEIIRKSILDRIGQ